MYRMIFVLIVLLIITPVLIPGSDIAAQQTTSIRRDDLRLAGMCSSDPAHQLVWRVRNQRAFDITFTWRMKGGSQSGTIVVPAASQVFFNTAPEGSNRVQILINGVIEDAKPANTNRCADTTAPTSVPPTAGAAARCLPDGSRDLKNQYSKIIAHDSGRIENTSSACSYQVGLASFRRFDAIPGHHELLDVQTATIKPGEKLTLTVELPKCAYALYLFYGDVPANLSEGLYSTPLIDIKDYRGKNYCDSGGVTPTKTFTSIPPTATFTGIPATATFTDVPPTATFTEVPVTATFTNVPPTATFTEVPATATFTEVPPTATFTELPVTATFTDVPATATFTDVPPTATFTDVPVTPTFTDVPATATYTPTPVDPRCVFNVADGNVYGTGGLVPSIQAANANGPSNDIICLAPDGMYALNMVIESNSGLPVVNSPITIWGFGATVKRDEAAPAFRILNVAGGGNLTVEQLTMTGGSVDSGGAIFSNGQVTLTGVMLSNNTASVSGGAFYNRSTATLNNTTISGNTSPIGGGIYNINASLTINGSTISDNSAVNLGGGVYNFDGTVLIDNSVLQKNNAREGAGAHNGLSGSTMTITNSNIYSNTATDRGGGLSTDNSKLTVSGSCLISNTSPLASALNNDTLAVSITATNNWWGRNTGPVVVTELNGLIIYSPFLVSEPAICAGLTRPRAFKAGASSKSK